MRGAASALSLLTRIPVPMTLQASDLRAASGYFGLIGLLFGALGAVTSLLPARCGPLLTAAVICLLWAWLSGGLHLDGVADVCDGMGGGRGERERTLAIMRDSRVGAHGVVGVVLMLVLKTAAIARCLELAEPNAIWLSPAFARANLAALLWLPNGRPGGLADQVRPSQPGLALALNLLLLLPPLLFLGPHLWPCILTAALPALWLGFWAQRRLGGVSGDVLGAATEAGEVAFLVGALCLL